MQESRVISETNHNQQPQANSQPANKQDNGHRGEETQPNKPLNLRDLFKDESDTDDSSESDDPSKPIDSLDSLMKRTKLTPEQAYAIKIPMPNGAEPLTLGQIKDRVGELVTHEQSVLQFEERRTAQEGEILNAQQEIRDLIGLLPREAIKPELVQKMRQQAEAKMARETELTQQHIPAWKDPKVFQTETKQIREYLKRWGFPESFLDSIQDHRAMKYIRDGWLRDMRIAAALKDVKHVEPRNKTPSSKAAKAPSKHSASETTRRDGAVPSQRSKLAAIFSNK